MATFIKQRKQETSEATVKWLRSKPIEKEVEAIKRQTEDHTKAMTAPLASDSFPDNGKSMGSSQSTMKPRARLPLDHTCDLSMDDTLSLSLSYFHFLSFDSMATTRQSSSNYSTESSAPTQQQQLSSTYSFVQNNIPN